MVGDGDPRRQQSVSARHYLTKAVTGTALQETVTLTAELLDFPIVQVNVLDEFIQHTIASVGGAQGSIPRSDSLCDRVVRSGRAMTLDDLQLAGSVPSTASHIHTYAGVPITGREGLVIGSLCIADTVPRQITEQHLAHLTAAAAVVQDQLELLRRLQATPVGSIAETATLLLALESGHIVPHYQPVVDILTGEICGVEALARWEDPARGLIGPDDFVPLAEDSEIVIDLDLQVLAAAVADLARWHRRSPGLALNVNLSARHFDHPDCVDRITEIVSRSDVRPADISFEVTETAALASHTVEGRFLDDLRERGFKIVLDDFGTGFSSMTRVLRLPIDGIKLDRTLTAAMGTPAGDAVSRALLTMASELDLSTVIEGVETPEQAERALAQGCPRGQGYLWSKAVSAEAFSQQLSAKPPGGMLRSGRR